MRQERIFLLKAGQEKKGPVVYWMSRDQRVEDNWALLFASFLAEQKKMPLVVCFYLDSHYPDAYYRHYDFMMRGLQEVENELLEKNINFFLLQGKDISVLSEFLKNLSASILVTDFDPIRIKKEWKEKIKNHLDIPFYEVDTHNIVPCRLASQKKEYAAYTIRPKINKLLPFFLDDFSPLKKQPSFFHSPSPIDWNSLLHSQEKNLSPVFWLKSGSKAAKETLDFFINKKLAFYAEKRNDPVLNFVSHLSPYLHFGQIASQSIVKKVLKSSLMPSSYESFLEEIIVRKELADNFCFYEKHYDQAIAFPDWAKKILAKQEKKNKPYYSLETLENAKTEDIFWNAAQKEALYLGKIHGYMRMYWAKKIADWEEKAENALQKAIYLNNKYLLDGRDPNGYTGIAWSIGGLHDRPFYGKIRTMSLSGLKKKINIEHYLLKIEQLEKYFIASDWEAIRELYFSI